MAVCGYTRVSTVAQADAGESLDVQRRKIEGLAMQEGWTLARVFVERAVSGGTPLAERPEGAALLAAVRPGDVVVCAKLDRMFRSAADALAMLDRFKRQRVALYLLDLGSNCTGNGIAAMIFTTMSAVAEFERGRIAERIAEGMASRRAQGRFTGGKREFGFQVVDGRLIADPTEQRAIRRVHALRRRGLSLREIAERVSRDIGRPVAHTIVARVLRADARD